MVQSFAKCFSDNEVLRELSVGSDGRGGVGPDMAIRMHTSCLASSRFSSANSK